MVTLNIIKRVRAPLNSESYTLDKAHNQWHKIYLKYKLLGTVIIGYQRNIGAPPCLTYAKNINPMFNICQKRIYHICS